MSWLVTWLAATPTPTPSIDPTKVTPGPVGFAFTAIMMLAVGIIAMDLMRRSTRANARYDIREQLEREAAAEDAAAAHAASAGSAPAAEDAAAEPPAPERPAAPDHPRPDRPEAPDRPSPTSLAPDTPAPPQP